MTHEKKDERPEQERRHEEFRKEFDALPLEKKIAQLMELEMVALGETLSFVLNSPYKIGEKVVDFLSEFGFKFEKDAKNAQKPEEHKEETSAGADGDEDPKPKAKKAKNSDAEAESEAEVAAEEPASEDENT